MLARTSLSGREQSCFFPQRGNKTLKPTSSPIQKTVSLIAIHLFCHPTTVYRLSTGQIPVGSLGNALPQQNLHTFTIRSLWDVYKVRCADSNPPWMTTIRRVPTQTDSRMTDSPLLVVWYVYEACPKLIGFHTGTNKHIPKLVEWCLSMKAKSVECKRIRQGPSVAGIL